MPTVSGVQPSWVRSYQSLTSQCSNNSRGVNYGQDFVTLHCGLACVALQAACW